MGEFDGEHFASESHSGEGRHAEFAAYSAGIYRQAAETVDAAQNLILWLPLQRVTRFREVDMVRGRMTTAVYDDGPIPPRARTCISHQSRSLNC